ncbi:MAG: maleylpyruvate isomerase N-terminal domain-containing protein [Chloroflexi bacterium]|nr:maleylpyruvate isomerase N-terminal domain-containing protein [Chloroflexota bacterium]
MLKSPNPVIVADLLPELLQNLLELLKGLEEEDWARSTVCAGWSVKDVALHLLGGDIGNLSSRRDGHSAH